jgi:streptomycin 6-kinase
MDSSDDLPALPVPERLARNVAEVHGAAGAEWLSRLPALLADCARRWDLRLLPPEAELSYNYVTPVVRAGGQEAILKVGVPSRELLGEMGVLRFYDGRGAVRLLEADAELGALLLERLRPGTPLRSLVEGSGDATGGDVEARHDRAAAIAAGVMRRLWRPAPPLPPGGAFRPAGEWLEHMVERAPRLLPGGAEGQAFRVWIDRAMAMYGELSAAAPEPVVLHGDLHYENILAATREPWLAIDAWGILAEPASEIGPFLLNAVEEPPAATSGERLARLIAIFGAELGLDRQRIRDWAIVRAVVSAFWTLEDHGARWEGGLACAEALSEVQV